MKTPAPPPLRYDTFGTDSRRFCNATKISAITSFQEIASNFERCMYTIKNSLEKSCYHHQSVMLVNIYYFSKDGNEYGTENTVFYWGDTGVA
jgi:hypothetical protein